MNSICNMNSIIEIAKKNGRDYITPEDVTEALKACHDVEDISNVRFDLLEVLGKQTDLGVEDPSLCAFIAWRGKGR